MNKDGLNFKQKITVLAFFIFLGIVVIAQTEYAYKTDISQQKERARLNAKVYADELCIDFEGGKNITDALDDTVVASNGQVNNFARIAEHEMEDYISSIQLAPDSKVQYIYPLEGNEAGLIDLLADKKRGEIVKYSIENKVTSMQGPFKLKQGGLWYCHPKSYFHAFSGWKGFILGFFHRNNQGAGYIQRYTGCSGLVRI